MFKKLSILLILFSTAHNLDAMRRNKPFDNASTEIITETIILLEKNNKISPLSPVQKYDLSQRVLNVLKREFDNCNITTLNVLKDPASKEDLERIIFSYAINMEQQLPLVRRSSSPERIFKFDEEL